MCPAALHDEQQMVFLVRLRIVADYGFQAHLAFHGSATIPVLVDHPQAGFPAAPYKDYPAQTAVLRGISLPAAHTRVAPAPAAWVSIRSAAGVAQDEYAERWCGDAPCVGTEQLHEQFRGQSFRPVRSPCVPRCPSGQAASRCRSTLLQISVPSSAAQWMQLDVSAACLSVDRFVLEYQE